MNFLDQIGASNQRLAMPRRDRGWGGAWIRLQRHPIPIKAFFRHSLVLTYAFPRAVLDPLLPPGLTLDVHGDHGFVAIAMVQTERLRPTFFPGFLGQNFCLTGYRIFARYKTTSGRVLRGLRILRSDADRRLMVFFGNRLTHYNYRFAEMDFQTANGRLEIDIRTPYGAADVHVIADLKKEVVRPPVGSPFADLREARLFAGPLPFTFDYEKETGSIIRIEGVRKEWKPRPVEVQVSRTAFFDQPPFRGIQPVLANAFHVENIEYEWRRGVVEPLPETRV
jgi:hypothetical protein